MITMHPDAWEQMIAEVTECVAGLRVSAAAVPRFDGVRVIRSRDVAPDEIIIS